MRIGRTLTVIMLVLVLVIVLGLLAVHPVDFIVKASRLYDNAFMTGSYNQDDLRNIELTDAGKDLVELNDTLAKNMGLSEGPLVFTIESCDDDEDHWKPNRENDDFVLSHDPCLLLDGVEDKLLKFDESEYILLFYIDYYPVMGEGVVQCSDSIFGQSNACLGETNVATPFKVTNPMKQAHCGFPDDAHEEGLIITYLQYTPMKMDTLFYKLFDACTVISEDTALELMKLGNSFEKWH